MLEDGVEEGRYGGARSLLWKLPFLCRWHSSFSSLVYLLSRLAPFSMGAKAFALCCSLLGLALGLAVRKWLASRLDPKPRNCRALLQALGQRSAYLFV